MKLNRPMRRTPPETIVALIDVVFFLLIFFMLIGRMDASAPFEVLPAETATGTDLPAGGAMVSVAAAGDLALDGNGMAADALVDTLRAMLAERPDLTVRINAHRDAKLADLLPLVGRIEAAGARDVMLIVTPGGG